MRGWLHFLNVSQNIWVNKKRVQGRLHCTFRGVRDKILCSCCRLKYGTRYTFRMASKVVEWSPVSDLQYIDYRITYRSTTDETHGQLEQDPVIRQ